MAGTVTQGNVKKTGDCIRVLEFLCVGDAADGSVPDTPITEANTRDLRGYGLDQVQVNPGTPAPDEANVLIKDTYGIDMLGGNGTALIHATTSKGTVPATDSQSKVQPIFETLTLSIENQATASAQYSIRLIFTRF